MTQQPDSQLKQIILDDVEAGNIPQKSDLYFFLHRILLWCIACIIVLLGACSFAILFAAIHDLRGTLALLDASERGTILLLLPYLWILLGGFFLWYAYRSVRQTDHGYRYPMWLIGAVLVAISVIGGGVLYTAGFAQRADHFFASHVPLYDRVGNPQHRAWKAPERGVIAGKIVYISSTTVSIKDIDGHVWAVSRTGIDSPQVGTIVRIVGGPATSSSIEAKAIIRPRKPLPPKEKIEAALQLRKELLQAVPAPE